MVLIAYVLLLLAIVLGAGGQLLLKHGMSQRPGFQPSDLIVLATDRAIVAGFCCYGLSTLLYLNVLATLDLSLAYPSLSLGYVLVIVMARAFLRESINWRRWLAIAIICVGVALVGLGSE